MKYEIVIQFDDHVTSQNGGYFRNREFFVLGALCSLYVRFYSGHPPTALFEKGKEGRKLYVKTNGNISNLLAAWENTRNFAPESGMFF